MNIYQCEITILENTFFASREVNNYYQTEALIGNYALAYATGMVNSPYNTKKEIYYYEHLTELNSKGIYITPAKFIGDVKFNLSFFNALSDTYWSRMDNNAVATDRVKNKTSKAYKMNYPQAGWIKALGIGNKAIFYIFSEKEMDIKKYIRLGKFMSKAKVDTKKVSFDYIKDQEYISEHILNPLDIPKETKLKSYDTYSINPVPLIENVYLKGHYYKFDKTYLPAGMTFGVDFLKKGK